MRQTRFKRIYVEITNVCNKNCSFCNATIKNPTFMSLNLFRKIIDSGLHLTHKFCLHVLGEPTLHPSLNDFLNYADSIGAKIELTTNGTFAREDSFDELLMHKSIIHINFSLHSFESSPENLGSESNEEKYLSKIFEFTQKAFKLREDLYINYRIWNIDTSESSKKILNKIEKKFNFSLEQGLVFKRDIKIINKLYLNFDKEFIWPNLENIYFSETGNCRGLRDHIAVLANGEIVPCCLDKDGVIELGNINEKSFDEIIKTSRFINMLESFNNNKKIEKLCQHCNFYKS